MNLMIYHNFSLNIENFMVLRIVILNQNNSLKKD